MGKRKRIFIIFLTVCLAISIIDADYKQAYAFTMGIPIEYVLDMILGSTAVESGVSVDIDNWGDFSSNFASSSYTNTDLKEWFIEIARSAILTGATTTLEDSLIAGKAIKDLDLSKYVIPIGKVISLPLSVKNLIEKYICGYKGYTELKAGEIIYKSDIYNDVITTLNNYNASNVSIPNTTYESYLKMASSHTYMTVFKNDINNYIWVIGSEYKPVISVNSTGKLSVYITTTSTLNADGVRYNMLSNKYYYSTNTTNGVVENIADKGVATYWNTETVKNNILYTNYDYDGTSFTIKSGVTTKTLPATSIELQSNDDLDVIPINNDLAEDVAKLNIDSLANTDQLMTAVSDTIANTSAKDTTDIWGAIRDIPQAIQDMLGKAFIPSDVKVKEFVDEATEKTKSRGGLFTYPIELVIRFLTEVNALSQSDCIIKMPKMEFKGNVLYPGCDFNFTEYVKKSEYANLYSWYIKITNFIMIVGVLALAKRKGEEIITGGLKGD